MGLALDGQRNANAEGDAEITAGRAKTRTLVVRAREDLEIARQARVAMRA